MTLSERHTFAERYDEAARQILLRLTGRMPDSFAGHVFVIGLVITDLALYPIDKVAGWVTN